jgi:hypothetical protein
VDLLKKLGNRDEQPSNQLLLKRIKQILAKSDKQKYNFLHAEWANPADKKIKKKKNHKILNHFIHSYYF